MTYDNTNRGAIWKNDDKREDSHPDFKGSINVNGVEFWVSAWKRKEGAPAKAPALSFSIKPKEQQQSISQRAAPRNPGRVIAAGGGRPTSITDDDMDGDLIPF